MEETEERKIGAEEGMEPAAPKGVIPTLPYDKAKLNYIEKFFSLRKKSPGQYTFNESGDLEIKAGKGKLPPGIIQLARFVPLEPSEREAIEEARHTALVELDKQYEEANMILHQAFEDYKTSGAINPVIMSNQRLSEIDMKRCAARAAIRNVVSIDNPSVKSIILSDRYEERKMFGKDDYFDKAVFRMTLYTFPPEVELGKYVMQDGARTVAAEVAEVADEPMTRKQLKDGRYARIFYDTNSSDGFLSPMWVIDFTMSSGSNAAGGTDVRYSSPIQAYEVERVKELGNTDLADNILKTRSPRTIRLLTRKVQGQPADAKGLWMKIYTALYEQHPNLKAKLLDTGSDTLVFADVREGPSGIGLGETDPAALDPSKWKSENAVGVAQETVRTRMREETQGEAPVAEAAEGTVTEEQQKRARVAAIINARRRFKR